MENNVVDWTPVSKENSVTSAEHPRGQKIIARSKRNIFLAVMASALIFIFNGSVASARGIDYVDLGDQASEQAHNLRVNGESKVTENEEVRGTAGRHLLPPPEGYMDEENNKLWGGSIFITMEVDPEKRNYFTARFWGDELKKRSGRLVLLADGKLLTQTGTGSFEPINKTNHRSSDTPFPGRFYYSTTPLPLDLTEGRETVELEIRHFGRFYRYNAGTLKRDGLYRPIDSPSRNIYKAYTHTDAFFQPPAQEKQGEAPPMPERLDEEEFKKKKEAFGNRIRKQFVQRVEKEIQKLQEGKSFNSNLLLEVYDIKWLPFYQDERIADNAGRFAQKLDERIIAHMEAGNFNKEKGGPAKGLARIFLNLNEVMKDVGIQDQYGRFLDKTVEFDGEEMKRRDLYADAFVKAQKAGLSGRRHFTNQANWADGKVYPSNRALRILDADRAMPEHLARRIVLEMIGLKPYSGKWVNGGSPEREPPEGALERASWTLYTEKGLSREKGYVGPYGEMQGTVAEPAQYFDHDPEMQQKILDQAQQVLQARMPFRKPYWREDYLDVFNEQVIGCRHSLYPGKGGHSDGYVRLPDVGKMHGGELALQLTHRLALEGRLFDKDFDGLDALRGWHYYQQGLDQLDTVPPAMELPVEGDNFVWTDEQNAVVAFKHGDAYAWVNFMFGQPHKIGINDVTRIHYTTPEIDRLATVRTSHKLLDKNKAGDFVLSPQAQYHDRTGPFATIPGLELYWAGEKWPMAKGLDGMADFYEGQYGEYYIALNTTADHTFTFQVPEEAPAKTYDIASGDVRDIRGDIEVPPRTTYVVTFDPTHAQLSLDWRGYVVAGEGTTIRAQLENIRSRTLQDVGGTLAVPDGWKTTLQRVEGLGENHTLAGNQTATVVWTVRPPEDATIEDYSISTTAEFDPGEDWGGTTSTTAEDHVEWTGTVRPDPDPNALLVAGTQADLEFTLQPGFPIRDMSLVPSDDTQGWDIQPAGDNPDSIEPGTKATLAWMVTPPADAEGEHSLSLSYVRGTDGQTVRDEPPLTATVVGAGENIAPFGSPFASSTHGRHSLHNMINGETSGNWGSANGWNDATRGEFPDWVGVEFDNPVPIDRVDVWTRHGNEKLSDFDIQVFRDGEFQTVASVDDNTDKHVVSRFDEVTTDKVRVFVRDAWGYSRVLELQVFNEVVGTKKR